MPINPLEAVMVGEEKNMGVARADLSSAEPITRHEQVVQQCRAVAHMARAIAAVHEDFASMIAAGALTGLLEMKGRHTADLMETLGDILNGMDAASEDDDWMVPVFAEAHRLWPPAAAITQATGEGR